MRKEWLTRRTTREEAEAAHMVKNDQLGPEPVPFGFMNARWRAMLDQMTEVDELWEFSSPPESWRALVGRAGIALVRNDEIVDSIVTKRS